MVRNCWMMALFTALLTLPFNMCAAQPEAAPAPMAVLPDSEYNFGKVVEGTQVQHEFILKNQGKGPLQILKVEAGWECTAATSTRQIPPGAEGTIKVIVDTLGYDGKMIREGVRIRTNDPERPILGVAVTGFVDEFAQISKRHIRLSGQVSEHLSGQITITPKKEYPFKIVDAKARDGRNISFSIKEKVKDGKAHYILTVDNIRKEKGNYNDVINIFTNSKLRRNIPLYILGTIR